MTGDSAREAALACLIAVERDDAYANLVMPRILGEARLRGRDAGFATELAYGALRMRGWYDAVIEHAAKRSVTTLDPVVRYCLWLGAHQVLSMRVPAHAAVDQTVSQVRAHAGPGAGKFSNAVMRRISERDPDAWQAVTAPGTSRESLALRHSHPSWVVDALAAALNSDARPADLEKALKANNVPARVTAVARPGLVDRDQWASTIHGAEPTPLSPYGVILPSGDPGSIPEIADGLAGVQDEGSQVVAAALLAAQPVAAGEKWLDLCSGPGGKAALLGALAGRHGAQLDALELHAHRAELVRQAVRMVPDGTVAVHEGDGRVWGQDGSYDRVLVDAPCTGLGALRRRPEARWRRTPQDLVELTALQRQLLASAARLVKPGGVVAYVTCSPVLAETRDIVASPSGLVPLDARAAMAQVTGTQASEWGRGPSVQMWTHLHGTDAMFLSLLTKPDS